MTPEQEGPPTLRECICDRGFWGAVTFFTGAEFAHKDCPFHGTARMQKLKEALERDEKQRAAELAKAWDEGWCNAANMVGDFIREEEPGPRNPYPERALTPDSSPNVPRAKE